MGNFQHPDEGLLLRYIDGELPGRKARQIRHHLQACWQCRGAVEELESTVASCVRYRKEIQDYLPAPPAAWSDLSREFARIDASLESEPFWKRSFGFPMLRQAMAGAMVLALAFALYFEFRKTPAVEAATLLRKAAAAEAVRPLVIRKIAFHTPADRFVRTLGARAASTAALPAAMETLFAEAHYSAEDPLSAQSFADWRNGLMEKEDDVSTVADPESPAETCYRIHTATSAGEVAGASLWIHSGDYHAVQGRIEFRDQNFIEFTEIVEPSTRGVQHSADHVEDPMRPVVPSRPAAIVPGASASISDQVQVLYTLHQIGADLGDPVEVSLSDGKVQVGGVGVSSQMQRRIHQELDAMPNVSVHFSEPQAIAANRVPEAQSAASPAGSMQSRLESHLGGPVEFQRFSSLVLKTTEDAMSRAYALRNLAQQVPADSEARLSVKDRSALHAILRDHLSHLSSEVGSIQSLLMPSLTALGATAQSRRPAERMAWQSSVEDVFRASQHVEVLLSGLLGANPAQNSTSTQFPSDVLTALAELRATSDACAALLAQ